MKKLIAKSILLLFLGTVIYSSIYFYRVSSDADRSKFYGKKFQFVIQELGPPDSILPKSYYSVQKGKDWDPVVVFNYSKENLNFFLDDSGLVIGVQRPYK